MCSRKMNKSKKKKTHRETKPQNHRIWEMEEPTQREGTGICRLMTYESWVTAMQPL